MSWRSGAIKDKSCLYKYKVSAISIQDELAQEDN